MKLDRTKTGLPESDETSNKGHRNAQETNCVAALRSCSGRRIRARRRSQDRRIQREQDLRHQSDRTPGQDQGVVGQAQGTGRAGTRPGVQGEDDNLPDAAARICRRLP